MFCYLKSLVLVALLAVGALSSLGYSFERVIAANSRAANEAQSTAAAEGRLTSQSHAGVGSAVAGVANTVAKLRRVAGDVHHLLAARMPDPNALFGSASAVWELNRRRALLFGGQRAVLMQVADPKIAGGVSDFSSFRTDSLGRLKRTMEAMSVIQYGSPEQSEKMLARLERMHKRVAGVTADGEAYSAMDPDLQYWVLATLVDSALEVERRFVGRFDDADRARYFESSKKLARAFGLTEEHIPADYPAFQRYVAKKVEDLEPSSQSKEIAASLFRPQMDLVPSPAFVPLKWVTIDMMPIKMAERYGLTRLNPLEKQLVAASQNASRSLIDAKHGLSKLRLSETSAELLRLHP